MLMRDEKCGGENLMRLQLTQLANMVKSCLKLTLCLESEKALEYSAGITAFTRKTSSRLDVRKRITESQGSSRGGARWYLLQKLSWIRVID